MGKLDTTSTVTLVINGEQSKTSLREITSALNEVRAARARMNQEENPERYQELIGQERQLAAAQRERREEVVRGTEAQKSFFADFKEGFSEIAEMSGKITAGTLIYKGISAGIEALGNVWSGSEDAFKEAEKTQAQLDAVLRSTGGAADVQKDKLLKLQQVEMDKTGIDDDVIAKGEEMLLTFTNVGGKIYEKALPAIIDYTAAMNGGTVSMEGIQTASIAVGKALNDPINGMTSLRKVGVTFNDQQKEQIKTMQESGDLIGAQTIILNELQKEFGGTAEAIRATSSGALDAFNTDLGNVQERIGQVIVAFKGAIASVFEPFVKWMGDTRSEAEKLTDEFNSQAESIQKLEKNTAPLITRYQELQSKGKLNKDEQKELKSAIDQIADAIPSAVIKWDQYGNALSINTDKAKQFIDVQKALLELTNKDAISAQVKARNDITFERNALIRELQSGKTTEYQSNSTGTGSSTTRDLTDKEIQSIREQLKGLTMDTKKIDDTIAGLTGSYLDGVNKKTDATKKAAKALTDMTVGELNDKLKSLNAELENTVVGSKDYLSVIAQINDVQKILSQEKKDKNPSGELSKEQRALEKYNKELQGIREETNKLAESARKGTVDDLDAQLQVIQDKYKKVIDNISALIKNPKTTAAVRKELTGRLAKAQSDETLEKQNTSDAFNKKQDDQAQKDNEDQFKASTDRVDNIYGGAQAELDGQQTDALNGLKGNDPAVLEAQRLNIKDMYAQKTYELEQKHLEDMKLLYQAYGKDTGKLDKTIADNTIKENDRAAKEKQAKDLAYVTAKKEISKMEMDTLQSGAELLESLLDKRSALYAAALIVDKAVAIANIQIHTEEAIAAFTKANIGIPIYGAGLVTAYTIAARIQEGLQIATVAKQTIDSVSGGSKSDKKAKMGALLPTGPSHDEGGIDLINNKTGEHIAEMEGGEPIMVLSKDTYSNNGPLINELLYNSQYRNGAPVSINTRLATKPATTMLRDGGAINSAKAGSATTSAGQIATTQNPELIEEIRLMRQGIADFAKKPFELNYRLITQYQDKINAIDNRVNTKKAA